MFLKSKNWSIQIKENEWNVWITYSIYINWKCESKLISKRNFDILNHNFNIQEEIDFLESNWVDQVYKYLMNKFNEIQNEDWLEISEIKNWVLTKEMEKIMNFLIEEFSEDFFLCWWTAISLYLWHRESIDFDLFTNNSEKVEYFDIQSFKKKVFEKWFLIEDISMSLIQIDFKLNWVKVTLFDCSSNLEPNVQNYVKNWFFIDWFWFKVPSKLTLTAMKLYSMWFRLKNKDFYDLYFLIKENWFNTEDIFNEMFEIYWYTNNLNHVIEYLNFQNFNNFEIVEEIIWLVDKNKIPSIEELKNFFDKLRKELIQIKNEKWQKLKNLYIDNLQENKSLFSKIKWFFKK